MAQISQPHLFPSSDAKMTLSSPSFDPRVYLVEVHGDSTAAELETGTLRLQGMVDKRTETLKALVKENFDRFVNAKDTVDGTFFSCFCSRL
jgi:exocyst complex component 2